MTEAPVASASCSPIKSQLSRLDSRPCTRRIGGAPAVRRLGSNSRLAMCSSPTRHVPHRTLDWKLVIQDGVLDSSVNSIGPALPEVLAKSKFADLAGGGSWQVGDDDELIGALEVRES